MAENVQNIINSAVVENVSYPLGVLLKNVYENINQDENIQEGESVSTIVTLEDILFGIYENGVLQNSGENNKNNFIGKTSLFGFLNQAKDNYDKAMFGIFCPVDTGDNFSVWDPEANKGEGGEVAFGPHKRGKYLGSFLNKSDITNYVIVENINYKEEATQGSKEAYQWRKLSADEVDYYYTVLGDAIYSSIAQRQVMTDEYLKLLPLEDFNETDTSIIANKTDIANLFKGKVNEGG